MPDDVADVIGQSAVGKGNVLPSFEQNDPILLTQPAQAGRRRRTPCNTADDDDLFHRFPLHPS